jgi:hypothetical protein
MTSIVPPPPERFDPITARWLTPGGPLPDPARDALDPDHREPVTVVGPLPPELAAADEALAATSWRSIITVRQVRWVLAALILLAMLLGVF